jgi:transposase
MRKTKLTREMVERCVELKRDGLCDADIIAALGVHPSTFYRWLKDGEEAKSGLKRALCDELKKAEAEYKRNLLTTIKSAAETRAQYWTAAAWLLERKYPMEYGKMERKADDAKDEPVQLTLGLVVEPMADDADEDAAEDGGTDAGDQG